MIVLRGGGWQKDLFILLPRHNALFTNSFTNKLQSMYTRHGVEGLE